MVPNFSKYSSIDAAKTIDKNGKWESWFADMLVGDPWLMELAGTAKDIMEMDNISYKEAFKEAIKMENDYYKKYIEFSEMNNFYLDLNFDEATIPGAGFAGWYKSLFANDIRLLDLSKKAVEIMKQNGSNFGTTMKSLLAKTKAKDALAEFSEEEVDPERMILHQKALIIQVEEDVDYNEAINRVLQKK